MKDLEQMHDDDLINIQDGDEVIIIHNGREYMMIAALDSRHDGNEIKIVLYYD